MSWYACMHARTHAPVHEAHCGRSGPRYRPVPRRADRACIAHELLRDRPERAKFNKVISPSHKDGEHLESEEGARAAHNRGRIELSALNSAFYARGCSPALSTPLDGDIINVNCTNCTVIARRGPLPFSHFSLFHLASSLYSLQLLSPLIASPRLRVFFLSSSSRRPVSSAHPLSLPPLPCWTRETAFASQSRR